MEDSMIDIPILPSICFRDGRATSICCIVSIEWISGLILSAYLPDSMIVLFIALRMFGMLLAWFIIAVRI